MKPWLAAALLLAAAALPACNSGPGAPKAAGPPISQIPTIEERIQVCDCNEDSVAPAVSRCVNSDADVDLNALSDTLLHWGQAQPHFSDGLFDTGSFKERYPIRDSERECLRRAFCKPMKYTS